MPSPSRTKQVKTKKRSSKKARQSKSVCKMWGVNVEGLRKMKTAMRNVWHKLFQASGRLASSSSSTTVSCFQSRACVCDLHACVCDLHSVIGTDMTVRHQKVEILEGPSGDSSTVQKARGQKQNAVVRDLRSRIEVKKEVMEEEPRRHAQIQSVVDNISLALECLKSSV